MAARFFIGTAGWAIRAEQADLFGAGPSHLARYGARFNAVEINSSFYRPHRRATYERWAASVPEDFRFAVKMPRAITHEARLRDTDTLLARFLDACGGLGEKLGPVLIQLPPSLAFEAAAARDFLGAFRARHAGDAACEARHASWFTGEAGDALARAGVARVIADPPAVADAPIDTDGHDLVYVRLHGAPRIYYSAYAPDAIAQWAGRLLRAKAARAWCVFDNTALGHAARDAASLQRLTAG